jgi:hypothetical protein
LAAIILSPDLAQVEIGSRVAVLWPDDDTYYGATVTQERNDKKKSFYLEYDDGEREWIDLRQHKFRLLEAGTHRRRDEVEDDSDTGGDLGSELFSDDESADDSSTSDDDSGSDELFSDDESADGSSMNGMSPNYDE